MNKIILQIAGTLLILAAYGCATNSSIKSTSASALERAALAEMKALPAAELRTESREIPEPLPSEPVPVMTGGSPKAMDADTARRKATKETSATTLPEEPGAVRKK